MKTIDGHTFDEELLTEHGWVIDAGCRGFNFTYEMLIHDRNVCALDIDNFQVPVWEHLESKLLFKQAALTHYTGQTEAYFFGDGQGNFLKPLNEPPGNTPDRPCETRVVPCITLADIYKEIGTDIDLLKLDIESAEYQILENINPIPRQITVEFHQHCNEKLHNVYIDRVLTHLCKHYHLTLFNVEPRYHFLDCLFVRKDIL